MSKFQHPARSGFSNTVNPNISSSSRSYTPGRAKKPNSGFCLALIWLVLLVILAVTQEYLPLRDPEALGIRTREVQRFEPPGINAYFGGDSKGRDIFARVVAGIKPAFILGTATTLIAGCVGVAAGVTAGFFRSKIDLVTTVTIDLLLAFPALILVIACRAAFGNSIFVITAVFIVTAIPTYARLARSSALTLAEQDHIAAAIALGSTRLQVLRNEFFPTVTRTLLPFFVIGFATVITAEGSLSFVGLSIDSVTWGKIIAEGAPEITRHWHISLLPSAVMFVTVLALNVLAEYYTYDDHTPATIFNTEIVTTKTADTNQTLPCAKPEPSTGPATHLSGDLATELSGNPVIQLSNVTVELETLSTKTTVLSNIDLTVEKGKILGVLGESGSSKSMLLRTILGLFPVERTHITGSVSVAGVDMLNCSERKRRETLGTKIGVVAQSSTATLHPTRTIGSQFVETILAHHNTGNTGSTEAKSRCIELLESVGLVDAEKIAASYAHQLSGGMYQRVTVALALANNPAVLLADEPTASLDPLSTRSLLDLLKGFARDGLAIVFVSHDLDALSYIADDIAVMRQGRLIETGSAKEVLTNPREQYVHKLTQPFSHS